MLDVIGVGYGRTGTFSLKLALEQLGFGPCYHAYELLEHPEHVERWERMLDGQGNWDEVFAGYRSTTDFPAAAFWQELVDADPDARVVLTVRDPQRWYTSVQRSILTHRDPQPDREPSALDRLMYRVMAERPTVDFQDADAMIEAFEQHNEQVRQYVPSERLLEFEVSQGWEPLCAFLGVSVPDTEFPRRNDPEEFERLVTEAENQS